MNNRHSNADEMRNGTPPPIQFSSTGDNLPPVENKDRTVIDSLKHILADPSLPNTAMIIISELIESLEAQEMGDIIKRTNDISDKAMEDWLNFKKQSTDRVNHPSHYTWLKDLCGIEVIDLTRHMDFDLGNAVKYILRNGHKSEKGMSDIVKAIEDLEKAKWYINDKIEMLKKGL